MVVADPEHILRLLDALLSNSLAYSSDEPWIRVRVRAAPKDQAEIEVEDRGRGIDPAQHEVAFERFVRLDSNPQVAGTGLGLYVARELARLQGGRLTLEWSAPGYGSRFVLSLPELGDGD
jgi:signal transduction histidine kinase